MNEDFYLYPIIGILIGVTIIVFVSCVLFLVRLAIDMIVHLVYTKPEDRKPRGIKDAEL